jgi:hypothetical protein
VLARRRSLGGRFRSGVICAGCIGEVENGLSCENVSRAREAVSG